LTNLAMWNRTSQRVHRKIEKVLENMGIKSYEQVFDFHLHLR